MTNTIIKDFWLKTTAEVITSFNYLQKILDADLNLFLQYNALIYDPISKQKQKQYLSKPIRVQIWENDGIPFLVEVDSYRPIEVIPSETRVIVTASHWMKAPQ